ncbi:isochorismatase family protein [Spiroplasma endosymbiont of Ammophila pubescens]|uniref:isochorismatase family protein n=1 Tax=Spiroplasma endosymbiont of Ammophila pubescens TaxID=3066315 RepID=UPI0032B287E4
MVDYQNDFVDPKGALYVPGAEKLYEKIVALIHEFHQNGDLVIATKDFHPNNHCSFVKWGPHCITNTFGSELYKLTTSQFDHIILKGTQQDFYSYSGFFSDNHTSNGLHEFLQEHKVTNLVIVGVATDVCISATLVDAIKLNYHGIIDLNASAGLKSQIIFLKKLLWINNIIVFFKNHHHHHY